MKMKSESEVAQDSEPRHLFFSVTHTHTHTHTRIIHNISILDTYPL